MRDAKVRVDVSDVLERVGEVPSHVDVDQALFAAPLAGDKSEAHDVLLVVVRARKQVRVAVGLRHGVRLGKGAIPDGVLVEGSVVSAEAAKGVIDSAAVAVLGGTTFRVEIELRHHTKVNTMRIDAY